MVVADLTDQLPQGILVVSAEVAASPNLEEALQAFHVVTEHMGAGRPMPVDRGVPPTKAEIYGKEAFLMLARHREFRRAPDLVGRQAALYLPIAKRFARGFVASNRKLCAAHGYEAGDIETYAIMWAHIFAHQGEHDVPEDQNVRLLWRYLRQRGSRLHRHLVEKGRETFPDAPEAHMALTGEVLDATPVSDPWDDVDTKVDTVLTDVEVKPAEPASRTSFLDRLLKKLAKMPHDDMVAALKNASTSPDRDYITQQRALRLLRDHAKQCKGCQSCGTACVPRHRRSSQKGRQEDVGAPDAGSNTEPLEDALG